MDDFEAALAAKFASVEETETTNETEPEVTEVVETAPEGVVETEAAEPQEVESDEAEQTETTDDRPRDEQGRFIAKERPEWLPPQFKSEEDFARSYGELQSVLGRQGQELGELRKIAEQIAEEPRQQNAPIGQIQNALEENPEAVAYWAAEQGNDQVLDQALSAWTQRAMDEGDGQALVESQRFAREIDLARMRHEFAQEVRPSIEQVQQESGKRVLAIARRDLATQYPDFDEVLASVTEADLAGLNPQFLGELQKTDPKAALETVYRWVAVGRSASTTTQDTAASEAARQEALAAKRAATVATSTSSPADRAKDAKDVLREVFLTPDKHSVRHGLTE